MLQQFGISYVESGRIKRHHTELCYAEISGSRAKHNVDQKLFISADLLSVFPVEALVVASGHQPGLLLLLVQAQS